MIILLTFLMVLTFGFAGISYTFAINSTAKQYSVFGTLFTVVSLIASILGCYCGYVRDVKRDIDIKIANYTVDTTMTIVNKCDTTYTYILNFERE